MNNTDTLITAATPEVAANANPAAAAVEPAAAPVTAPTATQPFPAEPTLDTLELIRREPDPAPAPDPSDTFLAHPRTSIWDVA